MKHYSFLHLLDFTDKGDASFTDPNLMNGHGPREPMGVKEDTPSPIDSDDVIRASMESLSASWSYQRDKLVLQNVTFEVNQVSDTIHDSGFACCIKLSWPERHLDGMGFIHIFRNQPS